MSREPTVLGGTGETEIKQRPKGANHLNIKALGTTDLKERGRRIRLSSGMCALKPYMPYMPV